MKTHELAKALEMLAKVVRQIPEKNIDPNEIPFIINGQRRSSREIAVNLRTLSAMSQINKQDWIAFTHEYLIPVEIRPRDASRDILGKVLRYLEENPEARSKIANRSLSESTSSGSPELLKALSFLLKEENEAED